MGNVIRQKGTWFVLTFIAGVIVGCSVQNAPPVAKLEPVAQAQPAAAGKSLEYKFFQVVTGTGVNLPETKAAMKEAADGGWEYTGYFTHSRDSLRDIDHLLFKRERK